MAHDLMKQPSGNSGGAMAIATSRQSADSQTQMIAAKHYPRDENVAMARILKACERKGLAEAAVYSYKKGESVIEGASIRLAEVMAQNWGNMNCGFTVLDSSETESQVMAFAWDLETNTQKQLTFPVSHLRVTKTSSWLLKDPREIYETVANAAARRVRACILALIPGDVQDAALAACDATLNATTGKDLSQRVSDMVAMFDELGVNEKMIEARLQTPKAAWTSQQVIAMGRLYLSIRDGFLNRNEVPEFVDADTVPVSQSQKEKPKDQPATAAPMQTQDPTRAEIFAEQWRAELTGLGKPAAKVAAEMFEAWKQSDVDAVSRILTDEVPKVSKDDNRIFQKLSRFANAIDAYIKEEST